MRDSHIICLTALCAIALVCFTQITMKQLELNGLTITRDALHEYNKAKVPTMDKL